MKKSIKISRLVHIFIRFFRLENFVIFFSNFKPILIKAIPQPYQYKKNSFRLIKRDKVYFYVDISDYMQWYLFANIKDKSWLYAYESINFKSKVNVIDIGANVGAFSLKLAKKCFDNKKSYKIYAFEPNKNVLNLLNKNISLNKQYSYNIDPLELAVGDSSKEVNFYLEPKNSGGSKVLKKDSNQLIKYKTKKVKQITLDEFVKNNNIDSIEFIKIDVEGYEPFVLDGCIKTLNKFKPNLYIEISPKWFSEMGRSSSELLNLLMDMNYLIFVDENNTLRNLNDKDMEIDREQFNIFAKYKKF